MSDDADLSRRLDNLLRLGQIAAVDTSSARCQVTSGGLLTTWIPWFELRTGNTLTWNPPTVGEQVLLLCISGEPASGLALTGIYSAAHDQPENSPDKHVTVYPDGARVEYDHASSALTVTGIKTATVEASEQCTVDCPENTITGNVLIKGTLLVEGALTYMAGMTGFAGAGGGATATLKGEVVHTNGQLSSNGVVLHTHKHDGVQSGGSLTGGPQ
jgi:phage baseplate assembly protein V